MKTKITKEKLSFLLKEKNIPKEISLNLLDNYLNFSSKDLDNILLILDSQDEKLLKQKREEYFSKMEDSFSRVKKSYQELKNKT